MEKSGPFRTRFSVQRGFSVLVYRATVWQAVCRLIDKKKRTTFLRKKSTLRSLDNLIVAVWYTLSKNISTFLLLKIKAPLLACYVPCNSRHSYIFSPHSYSHCTNYLSLRHFIYIRILFIILYFYGDKVFYSFR